MASSNVSASTLAPSDSVSQTAPVEQKKRQRPGRRQRQPGSAAQSAPPVPTGAQTFSRSAPSAPVPQPGKFPIVFPTGPGEPTRDVNFSLSPMVLSQIFSGFVDALELNPKFVEFSQHAGYQRPLFERDLTRLGLLGLVQQIAFSRIGMGLPLGDLGPVGVTDLYQFKSVAAALSQFGEFRSDVVGARFVLSDYLSTIHSLMRAAHQTIQNVDQGDVLRRTWIPTRPNDSRTRMIVATAISNWLALNYGTWIEIPLLIDSLMSGAVPPWWGEAISRLFPVAERHRFDFLFEAVNTAHDFVAIYAIQENLDTLAVLGLSWEGDRNVAELAFDMNVKERFTSMADELIRRRPAIAKFFSLSSTQSWKASASGKLSQLAMVETVQGVAVFSSRLALSAAEASLAVCFPSTAIIVWHDPYQVVMTTAVPISTRRLEFILLDWL